MSYYVVDINSTVFATFDNWNDAQDHAIILTDTQNDSFSVIVG